MWGALCRIVFSHTPLLSQDHKHQAWVQLRSNTSTRKFVVLMGMSQSFVAHMRKDVGGKIEGQRGGCRKLLANRENRRRVTLATEGWLGIVYVTTKQLRYETHELLSNIILRRALREVGLGAQVQQGSRFLVVNIISCAWGLRKGTRIDYWWWLEMRDFEWQNKDK
jgi:hypothetical protein